MTYESARLFKNIRLSMIRYSERTRWELSRGSDEENAQPSSGGNLKIVREWG